LSIDLPKIALDLPNRLDSAMAPPDTRFGLGRIPNPFELSATRAPSLSRNGAARTSSTDDLTMPFEPRVPQAASLVF